MKFTKQSLPALLPQYLLNISQKVENDRYRKNTAFLAKNLLLCLFAFTITACQPGKTQQEKDARAASGETELYQSTDLTSPGEFTSGIEGPAVGKDSMLYLVNYQQAGTIGKVTPDGAASLFVTLPEGSIGNGIRFTSKGDMMIADYKQHNVLKVNMQSKEIQVFAHEDGMNQPNDLAIMDNDIIFASDPDWQNSTGQLWRIDLQGNAILLEKSMGTTNGLEVSPDNKTLYVNESVQRNIWAYDLSPEGNISNKRLLIKFENHGMDGMRSDAEGNLYITRHGKGTVVKVSPEGKVLQEIKMTGKLPSNIAFGGYDGRTCYVTLQDRGCVETFRVETPGRAWVLKNKDS